MLSYGCTGLCIVENVRVRGFKSWQAERGLSMIPFFLASFRMCVCVCTCAFFCAHLLQRERCEKRTSKENMKFHSTPTEQATSSAELVSLTPICIQNATQYCRHKRARSGRAVVPANCIIAKRIKIISDRIVCS